VLPVERPAYLRQFGLAAALSHLQVWAAMTLALGLLFLLFPAARASDWPITFPEMVAISGLYQIWSFGACVALARHPIGIGAIFAMACIAPQIPLYVCSFREFRRIQDFQLRGAGEPITVDWPRGTLWVLGFLAILGVLLAWRAYRRWLLADID
jgi:hypothetical protein